MSTDKETMINEAISKHLSGESSHEDIILLAEWLKENEENKIILDKMSSYWNATLEEKTAIDYDNVLENLKSKISQSSTKQEHKVRFASILKYVAAIAITAVSVFAYNYITQRQAIEHYTYASGRSTTNIELPDGTKVILNRNSSLTYNNAFGSETRNVDLKGEAFFEVTKDEKKPFVVKLDNTSIRVLGTSFNVAYREENKSVSATLVEGSIEFESPKTKICLEPGERLIYNKQNEDVAVTEVNVESIIAWKDNLIRYDSLPFYAVMQLLESYYGVVIAVEDQKLRETPITGAFDTGLTIEQILNLMKTNIKFQWMRLENNNYYMLTPLN